MITLTEEELGELQTLWFDEYGEELSGQQVKEEGERLIRQFSFFCGIMAGHDKK